MEHAEVIGNYSGEGFIVEKGAQIFPEDINYGIMIAACGVALDYYSTSTGLALPGFDYFDKIRPGVYNNYKGSPSYRNGYISFTENSWHRMIVAIEETAHLFHFHLNVTMADEADRLAYAEEVTGPKGRLSFAFLNNVGEFVAHTASMKLLHSPIAKAWYPIDKAEDAIQERVQSMRLHAVNFSDDYRYLFYGLAARWAAIADINSIQLRELILLDPYKLEEHIATVQGIPLDDVTSVYDDWEQHAKIIQNFRK